MINHYLTIVKVANELHLKCIGSQISDCLTFRKNEFLVYFENGIQFSVFLFPSKPFIFLSKPDSPPGKNVFHFFNKIRGKKLIEVKIHQNDRILKLDFEDNFSVVIRIFSASSGIVLFESSDSIESLKNTADFLPESDFIAIADLMKSAQKITNTFAYLPVSPENIPQAESIISDLTDIKTYFIYKLKEKEFIFPFRLKGISIEKEVSNGSSELKYFALNKIHADDFIKEKKELKKRLLTRYDKIQGTVKQLENYLNSSQSSDTMERDANLLYSQTDGNQKGLSALTIPNLFSVSQEDVTIKLDPNHTLHENAVQIFNRIKNFKESKSEKKLLLNSKKNEMISMKKLLENLDLTSDRNDLKIFKRQHSEIIKERIQSQEISEPFHRIRSHFGHEILVGKHAKGNDFLLSKVAGKNDIWLHCKDSTGSHVIIPNPSKEMVSKQKIEEAASFAAFFSSQKKSDWVPVSYTFCKYVRKIKGSAPGAVVVDREEVLFVKPVKP